MDLSSSTTSTLSGLSILISGLIPCSPENSCTASSDYLKTIRNVHPSYLRSEGSRALCQVKVGIVRAHFQFSQYEAVLRCGLPADLIGVLVNGFGAILGDVFAAVEFANPETESSES